MWCSIRFYGSGIRFEGKRNQTCRIERSIHLHNAWSRCTHGSCLSGNHSNGKYTHHTIIRNKTQCTTVHLFYFDFFSYRCASPDRIDIVEFVSYTSTERESGFRSRRRWSNVRSIMATFAISLRSVFAIFGITRLSGNHREESDWPKIRATSECSRRQVKSE